MLKSTLKHSFLLSLILCIFLVIPQTGFSNTFLVTSLSDSGTGTLREAIDDANSLSGADTIRFSVTGIIPVESSLRPTESLAIFGPGADLLTLDGGDSVQVFRMVSGTNRAFYLHGVTIRNAAALGAPGTIGSVGAAVAGLFGNGNSYTIDHCHIDSCFNVSNGSLYFQKATQVTITNSAVTNNMTQGNGSKTIHLNGVRNAFLENLTISGNTNGSTFVTRFSGTDTMDITMNHVTIYNNQGNAVHASGAFINVSYKNCIFANNTANAVFSGNGATVTSLGHNISDDATGNLVATGDQPNTDPLLDTLDNNGGPTPTHALLPGSPAVNAGDDTSAPATDQRGFPRIQQGAIDVGAYESDLLPILSADPVSVSEGDAGTTLLEFKLSLSGWSTETIKVNYATSDGTADASDYSGIPSTQLIYLPGETEKTIQVTIYGDTICEGNETLFLMLSQEDGATLASSSIQGTINNDDTYLVTTAGNDQLQFCGTSTQLNAGINPHETGLWTVPSGDGNEVFSSTGDNQATFSGSIGVNYTLRWTVTLAGCAADFDEVDISFDSQAPSITCKRDTVINSAHNSCGIALYYPSPQVSDNCSIDTLIQTNGLPSGWVFPVGVTSNEFTVTDANGNTSSCTFVVTVRDIQAPQISCPGNVSVNNDPGVCGANITYSVSTSDNCPGEILQQTSGQASNTLFPIGITYNNFRVTDASGNTDSCSFTVQVTDNTVPTISCPSNISQNNDHGVCGATITYSVTSSDNCSNETLSQKGGQASGTVFPIGTTINRFTVIDASGNTDSCSFTITISDNQLPTISCPSNIDLTNDPGQCGRTVSYGTPVGLDNCNSSTQRTTGLGSNSQFPIGTTTETYVVTDASGNSASCSFTITISDDEDPVISLQGLNPLNLCEGDTYVEAGASATDNCDATVGQNLQIDNSAVNTAVEGNYAVTYTVTDVYGNSAQVTRAVIVSRTPVQLAPQNCGSCSQIRFDFCEGDPTPDLELLLQSNSNYEPGVNFLWYADNSGSQGSPIGVPTVNTAIKNTRFYWVSQKLANCEGAARRVRVRVRKTSTVILDLPTIGCNTGQIDLAAWVSDSRNFATGYTFYDSDPDTGSPTALGSVTATKGVVNSGQYMVVNLPSSPITYYATAINNTGCQITGSDELSSSAGASLAAVPNQTVNSGDFVQVNFSSPNATYILWYNLNNPNIGLLGSFGLGNIAFTAINTSTNPLTANIRAIAYNGNCAGEVRDFTITVLPGSPNRQSRNDLQFTASRINAHDVELNWQIQYEFALTGIEIEKQINDGEWERIDHQNGDQHGVGTHYNVSLQDGSYLDRSGMGNMTKYRLKLIHPDGRAIWSHEVEVTFDYMGGERFILYPNPSSGQFTLRTAGPLEGEWSYKLSDQLGRTILIGHLYDNETAFDIRHLPSAHYFLVLTSPEGKSYLRKIAKQ